MKHMTEHRPHTASKHDYLPAFGKDALLPFYDLLTRALGMGKVYDTLVAQAELDDGLRVLEIGCGTGNVTVRAKRAAGGT
jgi:ubiquinone/menaquinone biosynthesis C-methylase UbiE